MDKKERGLDLHESELMELLENARPILVEALNSLGGKHLTGNEQYLTWAAVTVNRLADGYYYLRESRRFDASKVLVRPALEAVFSATAAVKSKEFLSRKACSEIMTEIKLFPKDEDTKLLTSQKLEDLKTNLQKHGYPVNFNQINIRETAEIAHMLPTYDAEYRVYCLYTHGALRTTTGDLDEITDSFDTSIVLECVLQILEILRSHTPAHVPDLATFRKTKPRPEKDALF